MKRINEEYPDQNWTMTKLDTPYTFEENETRDMILSNRQLSCTCGTTFRLDEAIVYINTVDPTQWIWGDSKNQQYVTFHCSNCEEICLEYINR